MNSIRVRAVVQNAVDDIHGGIWAAPSLPVDEEDWRLAWVAVIDKKIVETALTNKEWLGDLWCFAEVVDVALDKDCLRMPRQESRGAAIESFGCASSSQTPWRLSSTFGTVGELRISLLMKDCPSECSRWSNLAVSKRNDDIEP